MGGWHPQAGELVAERFRLVDEIGRGGMGAVWRAEHVTLESICAVKFVLANLNEDSSIDEAHARFRQEARVAGKLRSRHVVKVLDHGVWQGTPYLAMELLEGESLSDRLDRLGLITPAETVAIMRGVAMALVAAAEIGIVHRDLKPENIFLAEEDGHEVAKVLDFGIAKATNASFMKPDHRTLPRSLLGTPHYMSPEQVDGTMTIDHRADLWSISVIVYECVTGQLPFDSAAVGNLMMRIMSAPIPVPSDSLPELPRTFDAWWARAASRDPGKRFATAAAWFAALETALVPPADADPTTIRRSITDSSGQQPAVDLRKLARTVPLQDPLTEEIADARSIVRNPPRTDPMPLSRAEARSLRAGTLGGQTKPGSPPRHSRALLGAAIAVMGLCGVAAIIWALSAAPPESASPAHNPLSPVAEPEAEPTVAPQPTAVPTSDVSAGASAALSATAKPRPRRWSPTPPADPQGTSVAPQKPGKGFDPNDPRNAGY